ncbi:hypothetical protein NQZ68_007219 [Dissostichus eleginoides]|nr:hypothetical protein NQZ68_007219 [Dissostichus eleginoides]
MILKRKEQPQEMSPPKGIGLITVESTVIPTSDNEAVAEEKSVDVASPSHEDVARPAQHAGSDTPPDSPTLPASAKSQGPRPAVLFCKPQHSSRGGQEIHEQ